jgi:hypothetical protein
MARASGTQFGTPDKGKGPKAMSVSGRLCDHPGCSTVLSAYNVSSTCWTHTSGTRVDTREGRSTIVTEREPAPGSQGDRAPVASDRAPCPSCGSTRTLPFPHAGPGARVNMRCTTCGHQFKDKDLRR